MTGKRSSQYAVGREMGYSCRLLSFFDIIRVRTLLISLLDLENPG
jgi:hypothetical protein